MPGGLDAGTGWSCAGDAGAALDDAVDDGALDDGALDDGALDDGALDDGATSAGVVLSGRGFSRAVARVGA